MYVFIPSYKQRQYCFGGEVIESGGWARAFGAWREPLHPPAAQTFLPFSAAAGHDDTDCFKDEWYPQGGPHQPHWNS